MEGIIMNDKFLRHIQDTADTLQLSKEQAEYLKNCMMIAYHMGSRDQLEIDHNAEMKRIEGMFKK